MIERKLIGEKRLFLTSVIIAYKNFSLSYEERRERSVGERHILLLAFSGALILFLANVPVQLVRFSTSLEVERGLYIGLLGFVSVFFLPLLLYFVSGVIFLACKVFGGTASFYDLRLAMFWSLNVAGPVIILNGLLKGFFFNYAGIEYVSLILQLVIAWIFSSIIAEAEQFKSRFSVFAVSTVFISMSPFMTFLFGLGE